MSGRGTKRPLGYSARPPYSRAFRPGWLMLSKAFHLYSCVLRGHFYRRLGGFPGIGCTSKIFCLFHHGIVSRAIDQSNPSCGGVEPHFVFEVFPIQAEQAGAWLERRICRETIVDMVSVQISGVWIHRCECPEIVIVAFGIIGI